MPIPWKKVTMDSSSDPFKDSGSETSAGISNEISCRVVGLAYRKQKMLRKMHMHM